ncbi:hypothetical protein JS278_01466 [Acidipropionibacterium virtanenii]|uniref:Uncharacterized protein n=2 Tax=Acidipropionibacterium virtanenii TaxID=2057246 RepID=A0A344UTN5_9ACTN|nr:hypothetical protein JS278_01466 [Acidipropionibacterium virtanenii]
MATFWAIVSASALNGLGAVVGGMPLAPDVARRLLLADRSRELSDILNEARNHLDSLVQLDDVEPLIASISTYVPSSSWTQVLLRDHIVVGLCADFLDEVEPHLGKAFTPPSGTYGPWLGRGTGTRVRWDEELRSRLEADQDARSANSVFARKLVGEMLSVVQRLAAVHADLTSALTGADGGELDDLAAINEVLAAVLSKHDDRVAGLGLEP